MSSEVLAKMPATRVGWMFFVTLFVTFNFLVYVPMVMVCDSGFEIWDQILCGIFCCGFHGCRVWRVCSASRVRGFEGSRVEGSRVEG